MKKMIMIYVLVMLCFAVTTVSAAPLDDVAMAAELCQAQSLDNMKDGVYAIPEKILNTYFGKMAQTNHQVKDAKISILGNDKMLVTINSAGVGELRLTCAIKEFHYDNDNALLELYIEKKEVVGSSVVSWLLNNISLAFLTDIYGNPMKGMESRIRGNSLDINLKPFATSLFNNGIGQSVMDKLVISKATTEPGVIYIHTNCAISILPPENKVN